MTEALVVENLSVRYRNGALGVVDVSFRIDQGQVVALFGANGAGKTTSVRGASGFLKTEGVRVSGKVRLFGRDVTGAEPHRTARMGLGFVPERSKIFPFLTVNENLKAIGKVPPRARRTEVYERVFELFPMLAERMHQMAGSLSGGQQQMLALGRAMVMEPRLLIVDEMTLGLHHSMQPPLFEAVMRIASEGTAVLVVDESTGFALEVASHCYLLAAGHIVDHGPAEKFKGSELLVAGYTDA